MSHFMYLKTSVSKKKKWYKQNQKTNDPGQNICNLSQKKS